MKDPIIKPAPEKETYFLNIPKGKYNVSEVRNIIEQLDNMLQTQQLDAIEFGETLIEQIPDGPYDSAKQSLVANLEKLDFDEARNSVLQLKQQIGVSG